MASADGGAIAPETLAGDDFSEATRRLSDKILAAFNHAYAVGETATAQKLRAVLMEHEAEKSVPGDRRGHYDPVNQADLWVAFVESRDRYNTISANKRAGRPRVEKALAEMKNAYQDWSNG
jgi:hypothetical protein